MSAETARRQRDAWRLLLAASFVPLLVKAATYVPLGSYLPLLVFCFFAALVAWGLHRGTRAEALAVRAWAVALILWAVARLGVMVLLAVFPLDEAHVNSQLTAWYALVSLAFLVLGVHFFRRSNTAARAAPRL